MLANNMRVFRLAFTCLSLLVAAVSMLIFQVHAFGLGDIFPWFKFPKISDLSAGGHLVMDSSNDEAALLSTHQLIERAGFSYENYYALADDGYITQLIRVINPLADANYLKSPPIMIQHGQTANSRNFVMQSNKQHHPMRYPPVEDYDENYADDHNLHMLSSSNRSLAFMLANNGYDVWLTSTRGVDDNNRGHIDMVPMETVSRGKNWRKNMTSGENELLLRRTKKSYWSFTLDDQIAHELPSHIATVLNVTGSPKVTLFGYSNTALTTFAMLSVRPDIAAYVDTYIASAPVVYYDKLTGWFKWFMDGFMQLFPKRIDAELFVNEQVADFLRTTIVKTCSNPAIRYTVCKFALDLLFGDSSQFRTNLELPFFGHLIRPTSWKCLAQHLQIVKTHKLAKFDYGPMLNMRYYNAREPPEYNLANINPNIRVALVSGAKDNWANQATLDEVRDNLPMKPVLDLEVPGYNHLDLTAAVDVDVRVNLPLLGLLDKRHAILRQEEKQRRVLWTIHEEERQRRMLRAEHEREIMGEQIEVPYSGDRTHNGHLDRNSMPAFSVHKPRRVPNYQRHKHDFARHIGH